VRIDKVRGADAVIRDLAGGAGKSFDELEDLERLAANFKAA